MIVMDYLRYRHQNQPPLVTVAYRVVHQLVAACLLDLCRRWSWLRRRPRILVWAGVVVSLAIQVVLIILVQQLVELTLDLMEVWTELAMWHFALTSVPAS
jgi:hypothetical protein